MAAPVVHYGLDGVVALVTGGGQGLGAAIARCLSGSGAKVVVSDIDVELAQSVVDEFDGPGASVHLDVTDQASVERAAAEVVAEHGAPTVLVNNAGIARIGPTEQLAWADWDAVVQTNLSGVHRVTQAFVPGMLAAGVGAIVNIGSANSIFGSPGRAAYSATKTGVVGLTRALAVEWAGRGVTVNAILPGYINTRLLRAGFEQGAIDEAYVTGRIPAGRLGDPADIGQVAAWLASPGARYVTGQAIAVDGGFTVNGAPHPLSANPTELQTL